MCCIFIGRSVVNRQRGFSVGDLNFTFFGEILTFAILMWFTMKFVWPPIMKAIDERQQKIAAGLAAAERGEHDLSLAQHQALQILHEAKNKAQELLDQAQQQVNKIIEHGKHEAKEEAQRILHLAQADIETERNIARQQVQQQIAVLALAIVAKFLQTNVDNVLKQSQQRLLEQLSRELQNEHR